LERQNKDKYFQTQVETEKVKKREIAQVMKKSSCTANESRSHAGISSSSNNTSSVEVSTATNTNEFSSKFLKKRRISPTSGSESNATTTNNTNNVVDRTASAAIEIDEMSSL
jgi:hypothetical protein